MAVQNGAGDFIPENPDEPYQIYDLPSPVLRYLFTMLTEREQTQLRQVCSGMKNFIDYEYGLHAYVPDRKFDLWGRSIPPGPLCKWAREIVELIAINTGICQVITNFEGKIIRSLKMDEMHPDFTSIQFGIVIRYPWKLRKSTLKYVDIQFLLTVLSSCRNLSVFHYETGDNRVICRGRKGWTMLPTLQPVPIPLKDGQLIEFLTNLPPITFQVDMLTSLSLAIQGFGISWTHRDWANVLCLLLSLSHHQKILPSLRDFTFTLNVGIDLMFKNRLQIIACVGQFLSACPRLATFEYRSTNTGSEWVGRDGLEEEVDTGMIDREPVPGSVVSALITKFGSDLLKELLVDGVAGVVDRMAEPISQIMREAGRNVRNLQEVSFRFCSSFEVDLFQVFISGLSTLRIGNIKDYTAQPINRGAYNLLFTEIPVDWGIEHLCVRQYRVRVPLFGEDNHNETAISLSRILTVMRSLKHLEIAPKIPYQRAHFEIWGEEDPDPVYSLDWDDIQAAEPDVTLDEVDHTSFQQLEVLKLEGVKITTQTTARLNQLTNLKELVLQVVPENRHDLFGMNSEDLLLLVGKLRKLDKISINMVRFPEDEILKSLQSTALHAIGSLAPMLDRDDNATEQYKFQFDNKA